MADPPAEGGGTRPGGASNTQSVLTRAQALRAVALSSAPLPSTTNALVPPVQDHDTTQVDFNLRSQLPAAIPAATAGGLPPPTDQGNLQNLLFASPTVFPLLYDSLRSRTNDIGRYSL